MLGSAEPTLGSKSGTRRFAQGSLSVPWNRPTVPGSAWQENAGFKTKVVGSAEPTLDGPPRNGTLQLPNAHSGASPRIIKNEPQDTAFLIKKRTFSDGPPRDGKFELPNGIFGASPTIINK